MKPVWITVYRPLAVAAMMMVLTLPAAGAGQTGQIMGGFSEQAMLMDKNFTGFSADRGRFLFSSSPASGKPDTPSCTSCHTTSPLKAGLTRAGKEISPMAVSKTPDRYTDIEKVEKWFRRNCKSVLGRVCSPVEKGDFLTFMKSQ